MFNVTTIQFLLNFGNPHYSSNHLLLHSQLRIDSKILLYFTFYKAYFCLSCKDFLLFFRCKLELLNIMWFFPPNYIVYLHLFVELHPLLFGPECFSRKESLHIININIFTKVYPPATLQIPFRWSYVALWPYYCLLVYLRYCQLVGVWVGGTGVADKSLWRVLETGCSLPTLYESREGDSRRFAVHC